MINLIKGGTMNTYIVNFSEQGNWDEYSDAIEVIASKKSVARQAALKLLNQSDDSNLEITSIEKQD